MKRIVRLTESDLTRIVRRVIMEQEGTTDMGRNRENQINATKYKYKAEHVGDVVKFFVAGKQYQMTCGTKKIYPGGGGYGGTPIDGAKIFGSTAFSDSVDLAELCKR